MNTKRGGKTPAEARAKGLQVIHRRSGADRRTVGSRGGRRGSEKPGTRRPQIDIAVLEESFAALAPRGDELAQRFYQRLFELRPAVRPLFAGVDVAAQQKKLLNALVLVIRNLRNPAVLAQTTKGLGARHKQYGVQPEDYPAVRAALLEVMAALAGKAWTPAVAAAWEDALHILTNVMLKTYRNQEDKDMAVSKRAASKAAARAVPTAVDDIGVLRDILEHAPINVMIADIEENIIFANRRSLEVLAGLESELAKHLHGFRADSVVGGSIHRFHKNPAAVQGRLRELRPGETHSTHIRPGPYVFELATRPLVDRHGERIGYVMQWQDVTEKLRSEDQAQRLQKAIDGAQIALMTIDRDLVINYVNEETQKLMKKNAEVLRALYPGFDPNKLLGTCIDIFHKDPSHQRRMLSNPDNLPYETDIRVGPLTFRIRVSAIRDLKGAYVGNTMEWSDVTELRRREIDVARLQSAINGATTNVMMCDADLRITYVNPAVVAMLSKRQEELRKLFPGFNVSELVGKNIDMFHKHPAHQRSLLTDVSRLPYRAAIKVGTLEFEVNATAILDPKGQYMGNMVEWKDITEQKDAERQVQRMIDAATHGNLDERIDASRYQGFMKGLGEGINTMLDTLVRPLRASAEVIKALAEGNLTHTVAGEYQGEFAALQEAVNTSVANLLDMVRKIREGSTNINTAASEISQGNTNLSQRTEEQASSLEETASSMEQMTSTVKQNADNAREANQLAASAREQAEKGGKVVAGAVDAMGEINAASKKIADIIGVIDEIAFQTNLLALNAAVEAARAGEQGRGFAVVASEVRNLAQRSAAAAKEIKALIKDSVEKVNEGTKLVDMSGQTLEGIVTSVKKVSDIVAEIAAASQEQSAGIEQVNKAVMQLDQLTQQNAALVEQAAAASESMDDQARDLRELMNFFDVGEEEEERPVRRPVRQAGAVKQPPRTLDQRASRQPVKKQPSSPANDGEEWEEF